MLGVRQGKSPHELATTSRDGTTDILSDSGGCIIGIDFGRTKCEAAIVNDDGSVALIPLELQSPATCFSLPSFVSLGVPRTGEWEVGKRAVSRAKAGHPYTVYDLTMLLGQKVASLSPQDVNHWPFTIRAGVAGKVLVECPRKLQSPDFVYPEQIAAMLLSTIKQRAETFTGKIVTGAVVTVPAAYNRTQCQALRDACSIAALNVDQLIVSSTASAVANSKSVTDATVIVEKTILVVDCGAGSLNVTLASVNSNGNGNGAEVEVTAAATAGDLKTGGEILTDQLFEHFLQESTTTDVNSRTTPAFSRRLRRACTLAQRILSTSLQVSIDVPPLQLRRGSRDLVTNNLSLPGFTSAISRSEFDSLCGVETWNRLPYTVEQVLKLAQVKKEDVDAVLVTGGAMQVPKFRKVLGDCFVEHWNRIEDLPEHTAAIGAALVAQFSGCVLVNESTPLALGIRSSGGDSLVVVPPSTRIPTRQSRVYYASVQNEIAFDILEGIAGPEQEHTGNTGTSPNKLEHCLGRVLIDGRRASAPLILKLEITFEVDKAGSLVVLISDSSNHRVTHLQVRGDETCLSTEAVALAQAHMSEVLKSSIAADPGSERKPSQGLMALPDSCPIDTLRAYVEKLKLMVLMNDFGVCVLPGDLFMLQTRIENASTWLEQLDTNQQGSQDSIQTAQEYLRQIRTLHLSSTASSALVQLRQELDLHT
ncbi:Heat shock protein 2 [Phytophthora citrophthora]|uniref:Heat shock protein 2 n=1 Tax=Phytophthora citrophthora TaxID=4793 RepID=A0AAD9H1K8_9STRA|nr:Heat shock protein 2 [Phytophthora citrophthora]